jgi:hypothetical protein
MRRLLIGLVVAAALSGWAGAQGFSGVWDMEVTIDPMAGTIADFFDFETSATVTYEVGGWSFTTFTQLDDTGWIDQTFSVGGIVGDFTVGMGLNLDPAGAFESWKVTVGTTFGGVALEFDFTLAESDVELVVGGSTATGVVDVSFTTTFGGDDNDICDFDWAGIDVTLEFPFFCADVSATIEVDCDGFDQLTLRADGIAVPALPWLTIDAELTYRLETKSIVLSPDFDFETGLCFDVYVNVDEQTESSGFVGLRDIHIDGLKLVCTVDRVVFTGISFWGATGKPGALGEYWEMYKIESNDETCCGPLSFDAAIFFGVGSHNLADISLFSIGMDLELGDPFTFSVDLDVDVDAATVEVIFGFRVDF